jgi:hypothetical protein
MAHFNYTSSAESSGVVYLLSETEFTHKDRCFIGRCADVSSIPMEYKKPLKILVAIPVSNAPLAEQSIMSALMTDFRIIHHKGQCFEGCSTLIVHLFCSAISKKVSFHVPPSMNPIISPFGVSSTSIHITEKKQPDQKEGHIFVHHDIEYPSRLYISSSKMCEGGQFTPFYEHNNSTARLLMSIPVSNTSTVLDTIPLMFDPHASVSPLAVLANITLTLCLLSSYSIK